MRRSSRLSIELARKLLCMHASATPRPGHAMSWCQPLRAVAASLFVHTAALLWLAATVGIEQSGRQQSLIVTIGPEPLELDELNVAPIEIDIQQEEYVEAPSLETPMPSLDIAGMFGDAPPRPGELPACLALAKRFRGRYRGKLSTVTCRLPQPLPEMLAIAKVGGGEALLLDDHEQILEELLVLVFGRRFRADVYEFFELNSLERDPEAAPDSLHIGVP